MEGHSQVQMDNSQSSEATASSSDHRPVARRVRQGLDVIETFVEIASRKERRELYNAKRARSRAWQEARAAGRYPAAYSLAYLEGEIPPVVEVQVMSTRQRRALFTDPYAPPTPIQLPATPAKQPKQWSFKEFAAACPSSNLMIGGTSASSPLHLYHKFKGHGL